MNIAIVGPGAIGLLLSGYLHRAGARLSVIDHDPERMEILEKRIRWQGITGDFSFSVPVALGLQEPEKTDLVIICVKAYDTDSVARQLSAAGYRGAVMTLQNGVDNPEIIRRRLPDSPLIAGITSEGAYLAAVDHVRHAGKGKTAFGRVGADEPKDGFLNEILALFRAAGLDAELSSEPIALIWSKALLNAGINALTAILGVRNGELLRIEPARALMARLVIECWQVLKAKGIAPVYEDPVSRVEEVCRMTAENYSSMYMDIKNRRRTEIDFINAAIVREADRLEIACPYNQAITQLIKALEQKGAIR
ncbi:MAG: 2-dehydropantoate 2-reductase [Deltaproteobacteria bacterium]|nr:2-dehydropantoate 2-reductase [Deltaproteobacteria bacterium]